MVFFFNDTATTEIYTLSLHDALPISKALETYLLERGWPDDYQFQAAFTAFPLYQRGYTREVLETLERARGQDRKSTRLNSSHLVISYAVFCLKKKKAHRIYSLTTAMC